MEDSEQKHSIETLSKLIEQVRAILIQTEDTKQRHEIYNQFINECKANNLTEDDFYKKVLKVAHKSIDWNYIEEEKKRKVETQKKLETELAEQENLIQSAPRYIDRLIKIAFDDGVVDAIELKKIFDKAAKLSQDINGLANKIDSLFDERKYKSYPKADFDATTLKDTLLSTNWYDETHYLKLTTPIENIPSKSPLKIIVISLAFLFIAGIGGYYMYNNIHGKSSVGNDGTKPTITNISPSNTQDSKSNSPGNNNQNISFNEPFIPVNSVGASSYLKPVNSRRYNPDNAIDELLETWWSPETDSKNGCWLRVNFNGIYKVSSIEIIPGSHTTNHPNYGNLWTKNNRITQIELGFSDGTNQAINLSDQDGVQAIQLQPVNSSYIILKPTNWITGSEWNDICISWFKAKGIAVNISSNNSAYKTGLYKCRSNRGYFYNSPDLNNQTKAYLVLGDIVTIETISNDNMFGYGVFTNSIGQKTKGWLAIEDLEFNSGNVSNTTVPGRYPQGSQRKLYDNDLKGLSQRELLIMKNEIYARNGYKFSLVPWVVDYFNSQSWYVNSANSNTNATNVYNEMNEDEKYNIDFIGKYIH